MPIVLRRSDKVIREVSDASDFPTTIWIIDPDLSQVVGVETKYWNLVGDVVTEMSASERAAVDAAELSNLRDRISDKIDEIETFERAFALVLLDEINLLRSELSLAPRTPAQLKAAVRAKMDN